MSPVGVASSRRFTVPQTTGQTTLKASLDQLQDRLCRLKGKDGTARVAKANNKHYGVVGGRAPGPEIPKAPTGIKGLDEVLMGGLPRGRTTLVTGGTGSG